MKNKKRFLCNLEIHDFRYYFDHIKVEGLDNINSVYTDFKECKHCGKKYYKSFNICDNDWILLKTDKIIYKEVK